MCFQRPKNRFYIVSILFIFLLMLTGCQNSSPNQPAPKLPLKKKHYTVYLTTDDGPLKGSQNIERIVREERVPMTVFLIGKHSFSRTNINYVKRYRSNSYVALANHSYTHANSHYLRYYSQPGKVLSDFEKNRYYYQLSDMTARLPGRNSWRLGGARYDQDKSSARAADMLASAGYKLYGWDIEWSHTRKGRPVGSAEKIYRKIVSKLHRNRLFVSGHLILLMHDQMFGSAYAANELKKLIHRLKADPAIRLARLREYPLPHTKTLNN